MKVSNPLHETSGVGHMRIPYLELFNNHLLEFLRIYALVETWKFFA